MRIASITTLAVLALLAGAAQAQVFCWTTKEGKRECGDTPPPGVKPAAIATPSGGGGSAAPADSGAKAAGKKPPADPEQDFRKRQADAQKAREKDEKAQEQAQAKQANCSSAREALRALESGQRLSRVDKNGERYFLDEQDVARETERARDVVQKNCT
ncbi:MAG TPA: hypothetical protein VL180_10165 [Burkholderiales bacterium]|jgi:hypothetical protein|nr:hypothetical protein [Burkholderiales bacterium]